MKIKSALVTQMSGSIGGMTGSHNSSGLYLRSRAIPVNSQTPQQVAVRNAMATLAPYWSQTLTPTQRAQWNDYAAVVKTTNTLGSDIYLSGMNWFVATNTLRLQSARPIAATAPSLLSLATLTPPGITSLTASTGVAIVTFNNADLWATGLQGSLLMFGSRPVSLGVTFFKGPYRFVGQVPGAASPPTSPQNMPAWPFPLTAGQKVFGYFRSYNVPADNRISSPIRFSVIAV